VQYLSNYRREIDSSKMIQMLFSHLKSDFLAICTSYNFNPGKMNLL
jgi:hypothetical protein